MNFNHRFSEGWLLFEIAMKPSIIKKIATAIGAAINNFHMPDATNSISVARVAAIPNPSPNIVAGPALPSIEKKSAIVPNKPETHQNTVSKIP